MLSKKGQRANPLWGWQSLKLHHSKQEHAISFNTSSLRHLHTCTMFAVVCAERPTMLAWTPKTREHSPAFNTHLHHICGGLCREAHHIGMDTINTTTFSSIQHAPAPCLLWSVQRSPPHWQARRPRDPGDLKSWPQGRSCPCLSATMCS